MKRTRSMLMAFLFLAALPSEPVSALAGESSRVSLGLALVRTNSQALLIGDARPTELATVGGAMSLDVAICRRLSLSVVGRLTGTWNDFDNGSSNSGKVEVLEPGLSIGPVAVVPFSNNARLSFGGRFEYSEIRSWSHARVAFLPYDVTGPRNFRRGVVLLGSVEAGETWWHPFAEVNGGAYLAGAKAPLLSARYRWLSPAATVCLGVRLGTR